MNFNEFARLHQVRIPVLRHADHYIQTLKQSQEFSDLETKMSLFDRISGNPKEARLTAIAKLVSIVEKTDAYKEMKNYVPPEARADKAISYRNSDEYFLALDICQGNWNILRKFDQSLPKTWEEFCRGQNIDEAFVGSKPLRQLVFGQLDEPRISQRIQSSLMTTLATKLEEIGVSVAGFASDEVIVSLSSTDKYSAILEIANHFEVPIKNTTFRLHKLGSDRYVKYIYAQPGELLYRTLLGIPGNEYFFHFRHYILNEKLQKRDMLFELDGRIAQWLELPHYMSGVALPSD